MKLTQEINYNMFREYDLRGIYETDITEDVAYTIGRSYGTYIKLYNSDKVLIGYDNRPSSPIIEKALIKGIIDSGVDVVKIGLVTTPMFYFARQQLKINTGIMITASHNPSEYNGFKISFEKFGNAYGPYINSFKEFTKQGRFNLGEGKITEENIKYDYLNMILNSVDFGDKKIKVVVDCANGTGSIVIKDIMKLFQDKIDTYFLYCESDGTFPNHHPDPSVPENMIELGKKVKELGYDLGIGIDGDADRVGIVTENGDFVAGDMLMLLIYKFLAPNLKNKKALLDVKCSRSLIEELNNLNIKPTMNRTGNSYANLAMIEGNFDFGGEFSGHLYFRDKFPGFDDGIYAGLRVIEILSKSNKKVSDFLKTNNIYYCKSINYEFVTDENKFEIINQVKHYCQTKKYRFIDIDGVRIEFENSWALIRASNTTPLLTLRFEAKTEEELNQIKEEFINLLNGFVQK